LSRNPENKLDLNLKTPLTSELISVLILRVTTSKFDRPKKSP